MSGNRPHRTPAPATFKSRTYGGLTGATETDQEDDATIRHALTRSRSHLPIVKGRPEGT